MSTPTIIFGGLVLATLAVGTIYAVHVIKAKQQ